MNDESLLTLDSLTVKGKRLLFICAMFADKFIHFSKEFYWGTIGQMDPMFTW